MITVWDEKKFKKLPKWAQEELVNIYRENENLKDQNNQILADHSGDGSVFLLIGAMEEIQTELDRVTFRNDSIEIEVSLVNNGYGDELEIRAIHDRIELRPGVSNVIYVKSV